MTLATGGTAFGEISIRSSPARSAAASASESERTPRFSPSGPTTRRDSARISRFMRVRSVVLKCIGLGTGYFSTPMPDKQARPQSRVRLWGLLSSSFYILPLTVASLVSPVLKSRSISLRSCSSRAQASLLSWSVLVQYSRTRSRCAEIFVSFCPLGLARKKRATTRRKANTTTSAQATVSCFLIFIRIHCTPTFPEWGGLGKLG